jgi:hypothetical protein
MPNDDAATAAENDLRAFLAAMAARNNPGSGRLELGVHHIEGWILEYDSSIGGAEVQAIVGTDGLIHARRGERSMRVEKLTPAQWVEHAGDAAAAGARFANQLADLLAFNGVT